MSNIEVEEIRAIRLIRFAIEDGYKISLYPEDDLSEPMLKDCAHLGKLKECIHASDRMTVVIRRHVVNEDAKFPRVVGATFVLIYGGANAGPISERTHNEVGEHYYRRVMG